jgi:single-stranded DNA-binding protein
MELKNVTIKSIDQLKTFDSGFTCVDFVVTTDEQYPQTLKLQANKEKAENLIKYNKPGDKVDISINLRGREWTNPQGEVKVFNTIEAWKVFKSEDSFKPEDKAEVPEENASLQPESDDSPF